MTTNTTIAALQLIASLQSELRVTSHAGRRTELTTRISTLQAQCKPFTYKGMYTAYKELTINQRINYKSYKGAEDRLNVLLWAITGPIIFGYLSIAQCFPAAAQPLGAIVTSNYEQRMSMKRRAADL